MNFLMNPEDSEKQILPQNETGDQEEKAEEISGERLREAFLKEVTHLKNLTSEVFEKAIEKEKECTQIWAAINSWNPFKTLRYGINLRSRVLQDVLPKISSLRDRFIETGRVTHDILTGIVGSDEDITHVQDFPDEEIRAALLLTKRQKEYLKERVEEDVSKFIDQVEVIKRRIPLPFDEISSKDELVRRYGTIIPDSAGAVYKDLQQWHEQMKGYSKGTFSDKSLLARKPQKEEP